jgi:TolB-like protein
VAGHADQPRGRDPGGFILADGRVTPQELAAAVGAAAPPVVFANSCHASTGLGFAERARGVSDLASSFLMRGTQHYIGPMWEVGDDDALTFALRFYEGALGGIPLGEAARAARQELARTSRLPLSFAGYVLYGEPRTALRAGLKAPAVVRSPERIAPQPVVGTPRVVPTGVAPGVRRSSRGLPLILGGLAAAILAGGVVLYLTRPPPVTSQDPPKLQVQSPDPVVPKVAPHRVAHTGPLRVCVFPFKAVGGDDLKLGEALQEAIYTDFGQDDAVKLIERGQIDLDVGEMDFEAKYADPATRAALGKLTGAELGLLGGYQRTGQTVRIFARFVDVESGEVVHGFKVDGPDSEPFALEEKVAAAARAAIGPLKGKLRP